ncbi:hypothetical protein U9M48_020561 [Paspalum notatum var. saurae]|uniref:RING-type E3 ubiquitin transferase n=1 Tax=Paspalum notatum var. saurae TaxID=547442 RepID=A0AAQ3WRU4_PASNO
MEVIAQIQFANWAAGGTLVQEDGGVHTAVGKAKPQPQPPNPNATNHAPAALLQLHNLCCCTPALARNRQVTLVQCPSPVPSSGLSQGQTVRLQAAPKLSGPGARPGQLGFFSQPGTSPPAEFSLITAGHVHRRLQLRRGGQLRPSPSPISSPMGRTQQLGSKKMRVGAQAPTDHAADAEPQVEKLEEDEATLVPVEDAAAGVEVEITMRIAKAKLHCPVCTLPLKPPVYQCAFGHLACGACRVQFPGTVRCYACGHSSGYVASTAMEGIVRSAKVLCPFDAYGCRSYVTYYHVPEHKRACPHAPCLCSELGCGGFAGPPAALRDHLRGAHSWRVDALRYGAVLELRVPESEPGQHRRVVVADDDGAVFLLAVGALGDGPVRFVSLVCARPGGAAAAGPRYACRMRAVGREDAAAAGMAESVIAEMEVPSSAEPGKVSVEEAASLVVLRRMLHGAAAEEIRVGILINKIV